MRVDVAVFRKLQGLAYRTNYSHRGKYCTLDEIARFDALGLWSFRSVWFSKHGTLLRTCEVLVEESEAGYLTGELEATARRHSVTPHMTKAQSDPREPSSVACARAFAA